jgi:hypothetical protein
MGSKHGGFSRPQANGNTSARQILMTASRERSHDCLKESPAGSETSARVATSPPGRGRLA